jgi:hypothetical protein
MRLYVLLYVQLATLLATLVALSVRKLVYVKHVVVHSSLSVNFLLIEKIMLSSFDWIVDQKAQPYGWAFLFIAII